MHKNKIPVRELERLFNLIIEKLKREGIETIETSNNGYWKVIESGMFSFTDDPQLGIGSIEDDFNYLKETIDDEIFSYNDFNRVATVLTLISYNEAQDS